MVKHQHPQENEIPAAPVAERLAYNREELCSSLGISAVTLWRLEQRKLIKAVPGLRRKLFTVESVRAFLAGKGAA